MAKNPRVRRTYQTGEEEIGFVTRSEDFLTENNGALSKAEARFAVFDSVTRKVESAIKSSTDSIEYLGKALKKVDEASRELSQEFFVKSTSKAETQKALDYIKGRYIGSGDLNSFADSSSLAREGDTYKTLVTIRRITGAENKKALAEIAKEKGFSVSYSKQKGFEDFATIKYRAEKTLLASYAQEHEDYLKAKQNGLPWTGSKEARLTAETRVEKATFGGLFKQSDKLYKNQKAEEERQEVQKALEEEEKTQREKEEKQRALEEKKQEAFEKQERRAYNQEQRRIQRQIERLEGKTALDGRSYAEIFEASRGENAPALTRKEELEAYKNIEAEDKKAREEQAQREEQAKEAESSRKRSLGAVLKIWAGITILADIARRILTAVLDKASKERSDFIGGASLGVSAVDVRNYRNIEKAKGLPEGSFMGFLSDLQTNFGDPRNINREALEEIAPYIPEAIVPLVQAGKMNLQELAKIILDKAQSLIEEGKDWSGEEVGVTESRRSILTSIGRFSPHAKAIAENMVDTDLYGVFAGQAKGVDAYLEAGLGAKTKFTETELAQYKEIVQLVDGIKGQFKSIQDDIMTDIVRSFSGIVNWLYNLDIGKSEENKLEDQIERQERVEQSKVEMMDIKATMRTLIASSLEGLDLASLGDKNFSDVDSMLSYMVKKPQAFLSKLQSDKKYASLKNLLSSEDVLAMLGAYKIAEESYQELDEQSQKPLDEISYKYSEYTQAGMAGRAKSDSFIQALRQRATPWEVQQYAMSKNKYYKPVVAEPNPFDDFGEVLTYIQEASDKNEEAWRDERMKSALDAFATRLQEKTGKRGISTFLDGHIAPENTLEAVKNLRESLKKAGYSLGAEDFAILNEILKDNAPELRKRITGADWELEEHIAPYQRALDSKNLNNLEQMFLTLFSASAEGVLLGAMEDAKRQAEAKGWDASKSHETVNFKSVDEGKLQIDVNINNSASNKEITVSANSRLTTPTLKDKISTSMQINNWSSQ